MTQHNLAFVFPGQGSQRVGMLAELAGQFDQVQATFAEASSVLGYDLWQRAQEGPAEAINLTECTQPLLLASSVACWRVWQTLGGAVPAQMAGHSLGEWSALVCAEVITLADAVHLVQQRGKFMQEAVPAGLGAMAAIIGLSDEVIVQACAEAAQGEQVTAVNFNSPGQVVIAGHAAAVERAMAACKDAGAKRALPLPVSAPFHTELMRPAAERLAEQIEATVFSAPAIPVIHNVHAKTEADPAAIKQLMIEQIYSPVRWVACVESMVEQGMTHALECGPGKVLAGLIKRIDKSVGANSVETPEEFASAIAAINL
ncbi:MAG TPA: ACP S-malonyltransferase [Cellvibrionaceae bacterium]